MPESMLSLHLLLPNLKLTEVPKTLLVKRFKCRPINLEIKCYFCSSVRFHVHQKTKRRVKDSLRHGFSFLEIEVTRYRCLLCKKTFTPTIPGIDPKAKVTARLRRTVLWACDTFADLKKVSTNFQMGNGSIYHHYFKALNLKIQHQVNKPWPKRLGVDEHGFNRNKQLGIRNFVTMFVDHRGKRPFELLPCRDVKTLIGMTAHIPGREQVEIVSMDLSPVYRSFVGEMFPQAKIIADPFHVIKLLHPALNKYRYQITDKNRKHPLRKMLLKKRSRLLWEDKIFIDRWIKDYPILKELYLAKEKLHTLYQTKGYRRARIVLEKLIRDISNSSIKELKTLKRTLEKWKEQILNYFVNRVSNARCEGLNNVAKSIIKRSYGLSNFANYRLRVLNA